MEETPTQSTQEAVVPQPQPAGGAPPKKSSKTLLIVILIAVLLLTAMIFFIMSTNRNTENTQPVTNTVPSLQPTVEVSPTSTGSAEEQEVEAVDVTDPGPTEIPAVEQDLQGL